MKKTADSLPTLIQEFLDSSQIPDETSVERFVREEPVLAKFLIIEQAKRLRQFQAPKPSTPSGMVPVYEKPSSKGRKKSPRRFAKAAVLHADETG